MGDLDEPRPTVEEPITPLETDQVVQSSQVTLASTEIPASPIDLSQSCKTETNDDIPDSPVVIPSSLSPPPSSQRPADDAPILDFAQSERSANFAAGIAQLHSTFRAHGREKSDYVPPSPAVVVEASSDDLRAMLQTCIAENRRLKMEAAHHKLQYNLLSMQAEEDMNVAAAEHEMTRRTVDALRTAEAARQARREMSSVPDLTQTRYAELKQYNEKILLDNDILYQKFKNAKRLIQDKEEEILALREDKDVLLNRIRENREHFHQLCSPGGLLYGMMTPKTNSLRQTPQQTPRSTRQDGRHDREHGERIDALLQVVLSQENNSAPSTPMTSSFRPPRSSHYTNHKRNVQSMSSLPTTPHRPRSSGSALLPSADLVPQSEPQRRYGSRQILETSTHHSKDDRRSRESTISVDDNAELARQALRSAAPEDPASFASRGSKQSRTSHHRAYDDDGDLYQSQASLAASEMLRQDARQSFEVANSEHDTLERGLDSHEKPSKLQSRIFASLNKGVHGEKRKPAEGSREDSRYDSAASPSKKSKNNGGYRDERSLVGLGIR